MPEAREQTEGNAILLHRGTRAVQRMVEFAPSTGGLALWVQHQDLADAAPTAPLVGTDGHTLRYAPAFAALPLDEQAGHVAHEVLHVAQRHAQRFLDLQRLIGDADLKLFNVCADAIVNSTLAHLGWLRLPAHAVLLDRLLASTLGIEQDLEASLLQWDVERLYREIDDRRNSGRRGQQDEHSTGGREDGPRSATARALGAKTAADLQPGPDTAGPPEADAEQALQWSERVLRAHANDGAFSMLRTLLADLPRTRTPWEHLLRSQLARSLSPRPELSWSRPARSYLANQGRAGPQRRMPWEPGFSGLRSVPRLVVVIDVSGSIDDTLMDRFAREIEAITRRTEAALVLVIGDDQVRRVVPFEPGRSSLREIEFHGRGGTDFTPLLEEADRHRPDLAVVLTDLDGPARFRPRWPVLWAVPEANAGVEPPFGRKLVLR